MPPQDASRKADKNHEGDCERTHHHEYGSVHEINIRKGKTGSQATKAAFKKTAWHSDRKAISAQNTAKKTVETTG
jgi:hypothetical protein